MARTQIRNDLLNTGRSRLSDLTLKSSDSVLDFITSWRDSRSQVMEQLERQALIQLSWVMGRQSVQYEEATSSLIDQSDSDHTPWWRVNAVENRLLPLVEGRLSKLLARQPMPRALPATSDEEDEAISTLASRALRHYWRNILHMSDRLWQASWWAEVTGTGFFVSGWDPDKGPEVVVRESDFINQFDEDAQAEGGRNFFKELFGSSSGTGQRYEPLGDAFVDVRTLFDVLVDPSARSMDEAEWALISRFRNIDEVRGRYGRKAGDLEVGRPERRSGSYRRVYDLTVGGSGGTKDLLGDQVLTWELWVRSSKKRPGGLHAVVSQDVLLQKQPNPYEHREIPVTAIQGIRVPMSVYGSSKVSQLMETQGRLNKVRSTKTEFMDMHIYPKILDPDPGETDENVFTTEFGEVIRYRHPFKPEYMFPPPMPSYVKDLEQDSIQAFQDLGDLHEVSTGQAPSGLKSGRAILALQAQDEARFGPVIKLRNQSLNRLARQSLSLMHQFVTETRMIQLVGDDLSTEVELFHSIPGFIGSQLVGRNRDVVGVDYFRVEMEVDSELPLSPEGQRLVIGDLIANGVLNSERDREMILRLTGLPSSEPLFEESRTHRSMAVRENRQMADGKSVTPFKWNRHDIHLRVHTRFMNSPEFARLSPEDQLLFSTHLTRHHHMQMMELLRPQFLAGIAQQTMPQVMKREMQDLENEPSGQDALEEVDGQVEALLLEEGELEPTPAST